jgi:hypothetical protein
MMTTVSAFRRRASAHLLQRPGPMTMSLANPSRIESMSGERQGLAFRAVLGRSIRSIRCSLCCNSPNVEKVGLEGSPTRSEPDGFGIMRN